MVNSVSRPLRVFLCHASQDKPAVRELYNQLNAQAWIDPWLDEEKLFPGMNWDLEISNALREADVIIICLSKQSIVKEGYVQREFKRALNFAEEKPHGTIYIIPLRLDDCAPPASLRELQWLDYFAPDSHEKLVKSLRFRAQGLGLLSSSVLVNVDEDPELYRYVRIPKTRKVPYPFYIGKYPVTNRQYQRFLEAGDFDHPTYWKDFLKYDKDSNFIGRWGNEGLDWLRQKLGRSAKVCEPEYWHDEDLGAINSENPVVGVSWFEASAYCNWLSRHWSELIENRVNPDFHPRLIRLSLDTEWTVAAGGEAIDGRFPWDKPGEATQKEEEMIKRANVLDGKIGHTTPVNAFWLGASIPYGVMDMAGNAWEWQANDWYTKERWMMIRGGSWKDLGGFGRVWLHHYYNITTDERSKDVGFRVVCIPGDR